MDLAYPLRYDADLLRRGSADVAAKLDWDVSKPQKKQVVDELPVKLAKKLTVRDEWER